MPYKNIMRNMSTRVERTNPTNPYKKNKNKVKEFKLKIFYILILILSHPMTHSFAIKHLMKKQITK